MKASSKDNKLETLILTSLEPQNNKYPISGDEDFIIWSCVINRRSSVFQFAMIIAAGRLNLILVHRDKHDKEKLNVFRTWTDLLYFHCSLFTLGRRGTRAGRFLWSHDQWSDPSSPELYTLSGSSSDWPLEKRRYAFSSILFGRTNFAR